jgi:hypothetical protein
VDANGGNFRLQKGSPAIGAGEGGVTLGPLEYPSVYTVDPGHPAATDAKFGYAAMPFKTLAKACEVAEPGETVVLCGGAYRETVQMKKGGITIRAAKGEKAIVSGADLVVGWKRDGEKWTAPLETAPRKVLRDGKPWMVFCSEKWNAVSDMTGICRFLTKGFFSPHMLDHVDFAGLVNAATGMDMTPQEIEACGERLVTLERLINLREGLTRADDTVPERFFKEDSTSFGPLGGDHIHRDKFSQMLDEYYELHGWDREGKPGDQS